LLIVFSQGTSVVHLCCCYWREEFSFSDIRKNCNNF